MQAPIKLPILVVSNPLSDGMGPLVSEESIWRLVYALQMCRLGVFEKANMVLTIESMNVVI